MFGVGGGEILVIALVALILFGTDDLPKNMRKFMKAWNDFRGATNDLQRSWLDVRDQVTRDILTEQRPPQPPAADQNASLPGESADAQLQSTSEHTSSAPVEGAEASVPQVESLTENTIFDSSAQEENSPPLVRPAQGALARGQLNEVPTKEAVAATSAQDPDKST
jgi:Sec-independent protein translocase protein TatA